MISGNKSGKENARRVSSRRDRRSKSLSPRELNQDDKIHILSETDFANGYVYGADESQRNVVGGYSPTLLGGSQTSNDVLQRRPIDHLNFVLKQNGFINRIDIKSGITATIAIFKYIGRDPDLLSLTRNGYIIVKLPPISSDVKSHEYLTYRNEFDIISQIAHLKSKTRAALLAKKIDGIDIIFNSPIFYDEAKFLESLNELGEDSDEIEKLIRNGFHNLNTFMSELSASEVDPEATFDLIFCSMLAAVNDLHRDGILHLDLADRNFVICSDGNVMIVDFGMADMLFKVNTRSRTNKKFPSVSLMFNQDALKPANYIIDVITDYVSLQKSMLQAICDYCDVNFYIMCTKGLGDAQALGITNTELIVKFPDEVIISNAITNLKNHIQLMMDYGMDRGFYAMSVLDKYTPYFTYTHQRNQSFEELRKANNAHFYKCTRHVHAVKSTDNITASIKRYNSIFETRNNTPTTSPVVSKTNVAEAVRKFSLSK